jgi:hypothetical protein
VPHNGGVYERSGGSNGNKREDYNESSPVPVVKTSQIVWGVFGGMWDVRNHCGYRLAYALGAPLGQNHLG